MFRGFRPGEILIVALIAWLLFGRRLLDVLDSLLAPSRLGRHESVGLVIVIALAALLLTRILVHLLR